MKVLVITPTYGRIPYLGRAVASFLAQDYPDKHMVIINDDKNITLTCDIPSITIINVNRKLWLDEKRNMGVMAGNQEIIMPYDDDDVMLPTRISNHVAQHKLNGVPAIFYPNQYMIYGNEFKTTDNSPPNSISFTRDEYYRVGGYGYYIRNSSGDRAFYNKLNITKMEGPLDFVYMFGGINYHVSGAKDETIEKKAYEQLKSLKLLGGTYDIKPNFPQYKFVADMASEWNGKIILVKHEGDCRMTRL